MPRRVTSVSYSSRLAPRLDSTSRWAFWDQVASWGYASSFCLLICNPNLHRWRNQATLLRDTISPLFKVAGIFAHILLKMQICIQCRSAPRNRFIACFYLFIVPKYHALRQLQSFWDNSSSVYIRCILFFFRRPSSGRLQQRFLAWNHCQRQSMRTWWMSIWVTRLPPSPAPPLSNVNAD